jgi:hypothetical protein
MTIAESVSEVDSRNIGPDFKLPPILNSIDLNTVLNYEKT